MPSIMKIKLNIKKKKHSRAFEDFCTFDCLSALILCSTRRQKLIYNISKHFEIYIIYILNVFSMAACKELIWRVFVTICLFLLYVSCAVSLFCWISCCFLVDGFLLLCSFFSFCNFMWHATNHLVNFACLLRCDRWMFEHRPCYRVCKWRW